MTRQTAADLPAHQPGGSDATQGVGRGKGALLEAAVLVALARRGSHGYDLRAEVETLTSGVVCADPGGLYRMLRRLESEGRVVSRWLDGGSGPRRREYELTAGGKARLADLVGPLRERARAFKAVAVAAERTLGEVLAEDERS